MEAREVKATELADRGRVVKDSVGWWVFSLNGPQRYRVTLAPLFCSCPDFETRHADCKHISAVRILASREGSMGERTPDPEPSLLPPFPWPRKSYAQPSWSLYDAAQVNEKDEFLPLLYDLCGQIEEPERKGRGRPSLPLADQVFACCLKVYSGFSTRRAASDVRAAREAGYLSEAPHHSSVSRYLESPELAPVLDRLIVHSALPLRALETEFAVDSSGFSASRFEKWYDVRHGHLKSKQVWVKTHAVVGTRTHIVCAAEVLDGESGDSPQLPGLVKVTATGFKIERVTADAAYAAAANFEAVAGLGGTLFTSFRTGTTGGIGGLFGQMYHLFCLKKDEYLRTYHRRSNIESAFSAVKRVFGDAVRSKTPVAMKNEVRCKMLCHNLVQLVHAMYELDVAVDFASESQSDAKIILKLPF
jgi:transposase